MWHIVKHLVKQNSDWPIEWENFTRNSINPKTDRAHLPAFGDAVADGNRDDVFVAAIPSGLESNRICDIDYI